TAQTHILELACAFMCALPVPHGQLALYVQEQASVQFVIPKQERQFLILDWIHRAEHVVVSYNHKHKDIVKKPWDNVEFNMETFALTLKNVQKNQSGDYVAKMRTICFLPGIYYIFHYKWALSYISAPVEAPVLTALSKQSRGDDCNVTVTCRGHDLLLQSNCNNMTCFPQSMISSAVSSLTVSVKSGFIVCNHSNQVSWKNVTETLDLLCPPFEGNNVDTITVHCLLRKTLQHIINLRLQEIAVGYTAH
uniref:Immunoglobulin V-set domain-containing protein n=1 Tax=Electrophorus electricus TaxID=8005 RepID=A0A4W4ETV1_ELEEL